MIDKSLRSRYQWGGPGGKSPGTSSSGGSRGGGGPPGGGDRQMTYTAPAKTQPVARSAPDPYRGGEVIVHTPPKTEYITKKEPVTPKDEIKNPFEETGQTKKEQAKIASDVQELRDKVKELKKEYPFQTDEFDDPEFYVGLDKYMEDKGLYSSEVEAPKGTVDVGFQEALRKQQIAEDLKQKQQDPDYGQFFRPQPVVEKPKFFDTGAGKFVKGVGKVALQPFIPEPVQRALTGIGAARTGAKFAKAITGKNIPQIPSNEDLIRSAFTKGNLRSTIDKRRPSDMPEHLGDRGFRTRRETPEGGEGGDIQTAITGEDVISESIKKYTSLTDDQVNYIRAQLKGRDPEELRSILAQAKSRIESGKANQMEKDVFALVQEYLVDPTQYIAHGGRIDKALGGRVRDI